MKQSKLAYALNIIIIALVSGIVIISILMRLTRSTFVSVLVTSLIETIIIGEILHAHKMRTNRLNLKSNEKKFEDMCAKWFLYSPRSEICSFIEKLLQKFTIVSKTKTGFYSESSQTFFAIAFDNISLSQNNLISIIKDAKEFNIKNIVIFCNQSENLSNLISNLKIKFYILNAYESFALCKKFNTFPINKDEQEILNKRKFDINFQNLSRNFVKPLLFCSFSIYISTLFTPYKIFNIIIAAITLTAAIVNLIFGKRKPTTSTSEDVLNLSLPL